MGSNWIQDIKHGDVDLANAYNAVDICLLSSKYEPFVITVLEAWAAKKSAVASEVGAVKAFAVNRRNSLLIPPCSINTRATVCQELISDDDLECKLVKQSTEDTKLCDWKVITNRW